MNESDEILERCDELYQDKERWYRMAELHCQTIERLKHAMREAMHLLDQPEPRPEAAFAELLLALNPELDNRARGEK